MLPVAQIFPVSHVISAITEGLNKFKMETTCSVGIWWLLFILQEKWW